jgi:hypothetical protein
MIAIRVGPDCVATGLPFCGYGDAVSQFDQIFPPCLPTLIGVARPFRNA